MMRGKIQKILLLSLIAIGMMHSAGKAYAAVEDLDADGIEDIREEMLIQKYVPSYYFHPDEKYFADTVDAYLARSRMRFHYRGLSDDQILNQGEVGQDNLALMQHRNKDWLGNYTDEIIFSNQKRDVYYSGGYFLEIPDDDEEKEAVYRGDPEGDRTRIYAHSFLNTAGKISIQYWVFLPYNEAPSVGGVKLNHEGDWEHITVELDERDEIERVYFASHNNEGKYYTKNELKFSDGEDVLSAPYSEEEGITHVMVYLALGTHASFPTSGTQYRGWYLPNDYTGEGRLMHGKTRVLNVGETEVPLNEQYFIQYGGLWGEIGATVISTGPKTPSFQDSWKKE